MINLNRKPTGGYIGVDIGSTSIKKVVISKNGDKYQLDSYVISPIPKGVVVEGIIEKPDDLIGLVSSVLSGSKDASGLAFAIPYASVATGYERVDVTLNAKEMEQHILSQLSKFIALPVAEVSFDYTSRDVLEGSGKYKDLMVVAAKSLDVSTKAEYFDVSGVKPTVATVDAFAIERLVPHLNSAVNAPIAVFDVGEGKATLYVVQNGEVVYSRDNKFGFESLIDIIRDEYRVDNGEAKIIFDRDLKQDEFKDRALIPYFEVYARTLNQMLELCFSSTNTRSVDAVYVIGGGSNIPGLNMFVEAEIGYVIKELDPFGSISVASSVDRDALKRDTPSLALALGLSLCEVGSCINLLPWREELSQQRKKSFFIGCAVAVAIGFGATYGGLQVAKTNYANHEQANTIVQTSIEEVDAKLTELSKVTELRQAMFDRMSLIQGLQTQRPISVAMLMSIVDAVPEQAFLSGVAKTAASFSIQGYAANPEVVANFLRGLKSSTYFDNVVMSSFDTTGVDTVAMKDGSGNYGKFYVTAEVSPTALAGKIREDVQVDASAASEAQNSEQVQDTANLAQVTSIEQGLADPSKREPAPELPNGPAGVKHAPQLTQAPGLVEQVDVKQAAVGVITPNNQTGEKR